MSLQVRWGGRATLERSAAALRDPVWGVWFGRPRHPARSTGLFCSGAEAPRPALPAREPQQPGSDPIERGIFALSQENDPPAVGIASLGVGN